MAIDGAIFGVADRPRDERAFGRPKGSGVRAAFPKVKVVSLLECGSGVLFGAVLVVCQPKILGWMHPRVPPAKSPQ